VLKKAGIKEIFSELFNLERQELILNTFLFAFKFKVLENLKLDKMFSIKFSEISEQILVDTGIIKSSGAILRHFLSLVCNILESDVFAKSLSNLMQLFL